MSAKKSDDAETPEASPAKGKAAAETQSFENGSVIDEPLVNSHVVGVVYDAPTDPAAPIDQGAKG